MRNELDAVTQHELEVLKSIQPTVRENLSLLESIKSKKWWPTDFLSFPQGEEGDAALRELREQSKELSDELLVVLIGNMVTEEALPSYAIATQYLAQDGTGISEEPFAIWQRGWCAEEDTHGRVLNTYLRLTGRVNDKAVDKSIYSLISNGFELNPGLYLRLFYPMFQEPATRVSHMNTARLANKQDNDLLARMCGNIAADEQRHGFFYLRVAKAIFNADPENAMIRFHELMKGNIIMPARLMTDGVYTEPPTLFDHFAGVAEDIGIYTTFDYAKILEGLIKELGIATMSVSGEAAQSQDYLCKRPDRIRNVAEKLAKRRTEPRTPVAFDWLERKV